MEQERERAKDETGAQKQEADSPEEPSLAAKLSSFIGLDQLPQWSPDYPIEVQFFSAPIFNPGKLAISICPGRHKGKWKRGLIEDLQTLANVHKIDSVVSLITAEEMTNITAFPSMRFKIQELGLESLHFPIEKWTAASVEELCQYTGIILSKFQEGKTVLLHCVSGNKRSCLVAACCLIAMGMGVQEAVAEIHKLRPKALHNPIDLITLGLFRPAIERKRNTKVFKASTYQFETVSPPGDAVSNAGEYVFEEFVSASTASSVPAEQVSCYAGDPDHQNTYNEFLTSLENNGSW
eukprot:TRINITY_DN3932_c0_g1_i1.p1 TRINITY_DN3932_c0_g1~~TRINITY_DN3932_c0_g1_i1.p1  ORF type:complete len:331 (-),score=76.53 TRINITY_DN3932_c0_g1_i1:133-1014(-)